MSMATLNNVPAQHPYSGYAIRLTQFLTNRRKLSVKPYRMWR